MSADEQAIRDLVSRWHRATAAGEVELVLALMAEDAVFLVAGHPPMKGRNTFEKALRGLLAAHTVESTSEIQEVAVSGTLAYCWSVLDVRITPKAGGNAIRRSGSAVSILRKRADGTWLVLRDANLLSLSD